MIGNDDTRNVYPGHFCAFCGAPYVLIHGQVIWLTWLRLEDRAPDCEHDSPTIIRHDAPRDAS